MKHIIPIVMLAVATSAFADFNTRIEMAECQEIASSGSYTGATVGAVAGGVVGAMAGKYLFGKRGTAIGGLAGAVGGGLAGEKLAGSSTYHCVVKYRDPKGQLRVQEVVGKQRRVGESIKVFEADTGNVIQ